MSTTNQTVDYILSNDQTEITYQLSKTAAKIALQNFEWRYITLLYFNSTLSYGVELFLRSYEKSVVIGRGTFFPSFAHDTRQYVLFETSVNNIVDSLRWMRLHEFDNTGKHIIICQSQNENECDEALVTRELWQHKITNVIFLKHTNTNITGFTYFPLSNEECTYHDPVQILNLTCPDFRKPCDIFPLKLRNLHQCPLIASTFIQPPFMKIEDGIPTGVDGNLLRLLAEKLNAKLLLMTPRFGDGWGAIEKNGTWSGSLADLYHDYANMSVTSAAFTLARNSVFQVSTPYTSIKLVWITHTAKKIPSSLKLAYPFKQSSQIAIIVSFGVVVIGAIILQSRLWSRFSRKIKMKRPRHGIVFYSWMICMGLPTTRVPNKTAFLHIMLLWIWYCVLLRTLYQVSLITTMKSNYYYEDIETLEEAIAAGYPFGGGRQLKDFFIDYPYVYDNWIDVNTRDIIPTLRKLGQGMEFVLAMNMETAKVMICKEKIHVHILSQNIAITPTAIFFKKYSPLVDSVNSVLVRLVESGFREKFYRDFTSILVEHKVGDTLEPINLRHYTGCYVILLVGWLISLVLFVSEFFFSRLNINNTMHF